MSSRRSRTGFLKTWTKREAIRSWLMAPPLPWARRMRSSGEDSFCSWVILADPEKFIRLRIYKRPRTILQRKPCKGRPGSEGCRLEQRGRTPPDEGFRAGLLRSGILLLLAALAPEEETLDRHQSLKSPGAAPARFRGSGRDRANPHRPAEKPGP